MSTQRHTSASARRRPRREISPWIILTGSALIIVAGLVVMAVTRDPATPVPTPTATVFVAAAASSSEQQTDFSLPGLDGAVALADYRGQYVLVNFWATWCPPCRAEMPDLDAYYQANQANGFTVLAVNVGEDRATVESFIRANGFDFPVALDANWVVLDQYRRDSLPSSFLIGPDGTLVKAWPSGALSRAMLEQDITPLLAS